MSEILEAVAPSASRPNDVRPLTGNEAIARGAWEAGVKVAAAYPGTPSTEILETMAEFPAERVTLVAPPQASILAGCPPPEAFAEAKTPSVELAAFCTVKI